MLSVLTPAYNRAPELKRCFESLLIQTSHDFDWVVVDDGSTDETRAVLREIAKRAPFPVKSHEKPNGGKHTALNEGIAYCGGDFVLVLDSDDELLPDAIATLLGLLGELPAVAAGLIGNYVNAADMRIVGRPIPREVDLCSGNELFAVYGVQGDTMRVYRKRLLALHPFPVFPGERLMPENVVWDAIDAIAPMRAVHVPLVRCNYQDDGYSSNIFAARLSSPKGYALSLESSARAARTRSLAVKRTIAYQVWCKNVFGSFEFASFQKSGLFLACLPVSVVLRLARRPRFLYPSAGRS